MDTQNPQSNVSDVSPDAANGSADSSAQIAALTEERDRLQKEKAEMQERLLYARAEFDNARRRAERERSNYLQYASMEAVRELLPVLDDFERALKVETADANYAKGVELIYYRLAESLRKMGLEPIATEGKTFDPNIHQAIERVHTDEAEDQAILGEFQRGYNFKGKLLRPAMVRVAVKP